MLMATRWAIVDWQAAARLHLTSLTLQQRYNRHAHVRLAMIPAGIQVRTGHRKAVVS